MIQQTLLNITTKNIMYANIRLISVWFPGLLRKNLDPGTKNLFGPLTPPKSVVWFEKEVL